MPPRFVLNRVVAAQRLERARQIVREHTRYGYAVTQQHITAVHDAERDYELATTTLADTWAEAIRENWARDRVAAAGKNWSTHLAKFSGAVLPRG